MLQLKLHLKFATLLHYSRINIIFCENMDQRNPLPGRITHRLNLDSEEEQQREEQERLEREQYEREKEEKRRRKEEKRKAKEQQERAVKQAVQRKAQQRKQQMQKYNDPTTLFQPDSDSGISFSRIKRKIEEMYPKYSKKRVVEESSQPIESEEADDESSLEQSSSGSNSSMEEESSRKKKQKKTKKIEKKRRNESESEEQNQRKKNKISTKIEPELSAKDKLVQQVAVRWNYALDEWPPQDYDYENELKKKGYRVVEFSKFKFVNEVVDGLVKVYELDGYKGVYRGKFGLIDVRPKEECPSLNYFYSKSDEELNAILRRALENQVEALQNVKFKQSGEEKLLEDLRRRVRQLAR